MSSAGTNRTAAADGLDDALEQAFCAYARAAESAGETVVDVDLAEACVRLRTAGTGLAAAVMSPLLHRRIGPCSVPDLTISAFEAGTAGFVPPAVAMLERSDSSASAIVTWTQPGRCLMYRREPIPVLLAFDRSRQAALLWISDAAQTPRWDRCRALLQILHWWLGDRQWQPIHAAAVCGPNGGVLIVGKGGAGKSTTALACLRAGWQYGGDDYVIIGSVPRPRVENIFGTARLCADMLELFPELRNAVTATEQVDGVVKSDLLLDGPYDRSRFAGFPIRAILLPRLRRAADDAIAIRRAPRPAAMLALGPSTMMQMQSDLPSSFRRIADFVAATPAYWFDLGGAIDRIPDAIDAILERESP